MVFDKNFPFGKGMWIWELNNCLGGDLNAIIQKCKSYNISYLIIKSGDGINTWDKQFTSELVSQLHNGGIKVYSWSFIYGADPSREAAIAKWSLDLGADGHIFDVETAYEELVNPGATAEQMLSEIRSDHPNSFLGFSPYANIDSHTRLPYAIFGKHCQAMLPQVYFAKWRMTPIDAINWCYEQWTRWIKHWQDDGECTAFPPVIPVAQAFDDYDQNSYYILKPSDLQAFIQAIAGYLSVSFWSFQHVLRDDCWAAIRDTGVNPPPVQQNTVDTNQNTASSTSVSGGEQVTTAATPTQPQVNSETTPDVPTTQSNSASTVSQTQTTADATKKNQVEVPLPATVEVPKGSKVTIVPKPAKGTVQVTYHKRHIDYVLQALSFVFTLGGLLSKKK